MSRSPSVHKGAPTGVGFATGSKSPRGDRAEAKRTWGSAALAEAGTMGIQVDEALDSDTWRLVIDSPAAYLVVQLDGAQQLRRLVGFLRRAGEPAAVARDEIRFGRAGPIFGWDPEAPRRLYIWINRSGKNSAQVTLTDEQALAVGRALEEAADAA
jgi:hypothetical protein